MDRAAASSEAPPGPTPGGRRLEAGPHLGQQQARGSHPSPPEAFTPERFAALQEQGALILIDVFADWCPTCAQQQKILAGFQAEHTDVPLHILEVDFDDQKQYVTHFRAPRQSTLILYRGEEQLWFSVAETRAGVIVAELTKGAARASNR